MAGGEEINTPHTAEKEGEYQQTRGGAGHWNDARAACWSLSVEGRAFVGREPPDFANQSANQIANTGRYRQGLGPPVLCVRPLKTSS